MGVRWLTAVLSSVALAACGAVDTVSSPETTVTAPPISAWVSAFAQFDTATVVVRDAGGERALEVWLAAEEPQRQRGLMEVTDPALEGRAGMAFWFDAPTEGGFWMRNTRLSLTIVFVDDGGGVVSIATMEPCPDTEARCPVTRPAGPYRWALEVPTSRWAEMGIDPDSALVLQRDSVSATGSS